MKLKYVLIGSLIFLSAFSAVAQHQILSLEETVEQATQRANAIVLAEKDKQIAKAQFKETQAIFLPQLSLSYTAMTTDNPLNAFGFKLQQQRVSQEDFNPMLLNNPGGTQDYAAQAMLQQPIFNWDMINMRKAAKLQIDIMDLQKARQLDYIRMQTEHDYLQLQFAYDAVETIEQSLKTAEALYEFTQNYYDQGYVQKSDLLNVGVYVKAMQTQLQVAQSEIENASDNLNRLIGKPVGTVYEVPKLTQKEFIEIAELPTDRADFEAMNKAIESYEKMIKSTKSGAVPKLNGFASYQFNDAKIAGFDNGSYLAGLELKWDVFKGNSIRNKSRTQQIQKEKIEEERRQMIEEGHQELAKANRQLVAIQNQILLTQAAVEQAEEALTILQNRYEQGLVGMTDLLLAQQQLAQQKLQAQETLLHHNMTLAYIKFLTEN